MKKDNRDKKRIRKIHRVIRGAINALYGPYAKARCNADIGRFNKPENTPCIILFNRQTAYDSVFVSMAVKDDLYFVVGEEILSMSAISKLLHFSVAPVLIKTRVKDPNAMENCAKIIKEGGSIAIAPEGGRTYSGKTEYIKPAIAEFVKKLGVPVVFFRVEGGYGVQPRWSDVVRRGKMKCTVSRILHPAEYITMSNSDLHKLITEELFVNEASFTGEYNHYSPAEYLERAIYICPSCGLSVFQSRADVIECRRCNKKTRYLPTKELVGIGTDFPFKFVSDWFDYQTDFMNALSFDSLPDGSLYTDAVTFSKLSPNKKKEKIFKKARLLLYKDGFSVTYGRDTVNFPFDTLSAVSITGKNTINLFSEEDIFTIEGDKRFCAVKYANFYHRYANIKKKMLD